jgi:integrase
MRPIVPKDNNGSIRIRFSLSGRQYSFNPLPGGKFSNKRDLDHARAIATKIQNDILAGVFDPTLSRYKPQITSTSQQESLLAIWDAWVEHLNLSAATKADHYEMIRKMILKSQTGLKDLIWFTGSDLAASTFNKRLSYLKACLTWAVENELADSNPFEKIKPRKAVRPQVKPFTLTELRDILATFDKRFPHYKPFVQFMLTTGVRTSEAIGLRWRRIDFDRREILINESMPKDRTGNGYKRIRKGTKTANSRYLNMNDDLCSLLLSIRPATCLPDDLVFKSAKGCVIDAGNFREDWKEVLLSLGIEYRKPYTTRHTLLSHAIEQGVPITGVAYIAGHADTRMVMQTYGHLINRPNLPEFDI